MRKRLTAILLAVVGLGVPVIVAWLTRRAERTAAPDLTRPAPMAAAASPLLGGTVAGPRPQPAGAPATAAPSHVVPVLEPHPSGIFAAIGRFDYRFRRVLPILGLALVIGVNLWARVDGGKLIQGGWVITGSEEQRASALLADRFGAQATSVLFVYRDPSGNAAAPAFQAKVKESLAAVARDSAVTGILTYADTGAAQLLSRDGTMTMAAVALSRSVEDAVADAARVADEVQAPPGVEVTVTGIPLLYHEFNEKIESDLLRAEMISLPIALLILLGVFGTLVAAGLPLLIAGFALLSAFSVIELLAAVTSMSVFVNNLASMIGLALSIDYSLFMVSRFREELRHHSVEIAVERMMGSVGKAVAVSGIAVAIGLSSLVAFHAQALRSMGYAGMVTVLSTLLFGLTVLPGILAMLGPRVNRLRIPMPRFLRVVEDDPEVATLRQGRGVWGWIARRVMSHPIVIGVPVLALLLAAGSPFLSIQLSTGQNLQDLPTTPARSAILTVINDFPGGETDPITVAVTWPGSTLGGSLDASRQAALSAYVQSLDGVRNVGEVESPLTPPGGMEAQAYRQLLALPPGQRPAQAAGVTEYLKEWIARDTVKVTVFAKLPTTPGGERVLPDSEAGRQLVRDVRGVAPPPGAQALTAGLSSRSEDFMSSFYSSVPTAVLIVVLVTGGVLFLTFGSVFLPLKAVLMSLISISASFGALVWVFQQGHLADTLGFQASGATGAWLPLLMFAIMFGLSMDYEVLLLSRIRERYLATGDNTRAVAEGIGVTGGIITGAALIMVAVFAAFGMSGIIFIKALGLIMALGVLIDATLVRGLLVPAFMRVMGWVNWWAPRWLQRAVSKLGLYEDVDDVRHTHVAPVSLSAR